MKTIVLIVFKALLDAGVVAPQGDNEGRPLYSVYPEPGIAIEYAYKGEVLQWISTGFTDWKYNEDFPDNPLEADLSDTEARVE